MMIKSLFNNYKSVRLAKQQKKMLVSLDLQTQQLTKRDIASWRKGWQAAMNIENPNRLSLYSVYADTLIDNHLSGAIEQRKDMVLQKAFKLINKNGEDKPEITAIFESRWFKQFVNLALDSNYWGHSLIEFGEAVTVGAKTVFSDVKLVPRQHVVPEYGVILKNPSDEWKKGFPYREGEISKWCLEAGDSNSLGLLLKVTPQAISKRYMLAYWDTFGEIFGMPIRIARTASRDEGERKGIYSVLEKMGAKSFGVLPADTEIEFKETSRGDAYNVYDKRIERADAEMSKCILGQTMTMDNGSSKAQGEIHLEVLKNIVNQDADFIKDLVNDSLIPFMIEHHGFKNLSGYQFAWDETIDFTQDQQTAIETMLLQHYDVDPQYFVDKYNISLERKKSINLSKGFFD